MDKAQIIIARTVSEAEKAEAIYAMKMAAANYPKYGKVVKKVG